MATWLPLHQRVRAEKQRFHERSSQREGGDSERLCRLAETRPVGVAPRNSHSSEKADGPRPEILIGHDPDLVAAE
jgi:hypothetical protein